MNEEEQLQYAISLSKQDVSKTTASSFHPRPTFLDGQVDDNNEEDSTQSTNNKNQSAPTSSYFLSNIFSNKFTDALQKFTGPRVKEIKRRADSNQAALTGLATPPKIKIVTEKPPTMAKNTEDINILDDYDDDMKKAMEASLKTHKEEINNRKLVNLNN